MIFGRKKDRSVAQAPTIPALWLDQPDAPDRIHRAECDSWIKSAAKTFCQDGIAILRGMHDAELCERVISDYQQYVEQNQTYVDKNRDDLGHEKRLVNFHHHSEAAMRIGLAPPMMELFDYLFGLEAGIYTSLTFKYGTQQPVHRDTPHFATWPGRYFLGYWTALRDVQPEAGPLFYYRNGHTAKVEPAPFWQSARENLPKASKTEQLALALDLYNGEIIRNAPKWGTHMVPEIRQGDVLIWHAETPHGGSPAKDPEIPRWSIVFHCAPKEIQVHQHNAFFTHEGPEPPKPRYGFEEVNGRAVASAGGVAFM